MASAFQIVATLHQPKRNYYDAARQQSLAIRNHFARLAESEDAEFKSRVVQDMLPPMQVIDDINDGYLVEKLARDKIDLILLFGTQILGPHWLQAFPGRIVNLHLGLSPFYRGAATLFWPFVNRELACVGATIHLAVERVDAGAILRRVRAEPVIGDSYYSLTTRLIRQAIHQVPSTAAAYLAGAITPLPQTIDGTRAYRMRDFNDAVLQEALDFVGDGLTAAQIDEATRSTKCAFLR
jgi:folate-dependent phosphoribosylglycinamide formyltransferase PurN